MKRIANELILDLFSAENLAAVAAQKAAATVTTTTCADERVVSIFAYAESTKGINDYPESYDSLRVRGSKQKLDELLADVA